MMFDLDAAIRQWRRSLRSQPAFEDGDIEELEDHFRSKIDELLNEGLSPKKAFDQVIKEDYPNLELLDRQFNDERKLKSTAFSMFRNFIKVGLRSIQKHRTYSTINIVGLTVGFACVFGIIIYLQQELSYDQYHENGKDIYRANLHFIRASGEIHYPIIPPAFGPEIKSNLAEIKAATRLRYAYPIIMRHEQQSFFEQRVFFAENEFLQMFSFPLLQGNVDDVLKAPNTIVITEEMSKKYFGEVSPMGQIINYNNEIDLQVVGILKDIPINSHLDFDFLISFNTFKVGPGGLEPLTSWRWLGFLTYLQLHEGANLADVTQKATDLFMANNNSASNRKVDVELQPLNNIYLGSGDISNPMGGLFRINDAENLKSLAIVAVLIIVIAFFNYFNILAALMYTRTKEIGVRKILGSSRLRIVKQMLVETCLVVIISGVLSLGLVWLVSGLGYLPAMSSQAIVWVLLLMLGLCLSFGMINGLYLGTSLASQGILSLLRNNLVVKNARFSLRKVVLLVQYGISAALIMISFIVVNQLSYWNKKDLGYDQEGIMVAGFRGDDVQNKKEAFRNVLNGNSMVSSITFGPALDGSASGSPLRPKEWPEEEVVQTAYFGVDYDFDKVIGLEVLEGRFFDRAIASDSVNAILINETLAERLDLENPIGKRVEFAGMADAMIIGIFKDFHHQSLHHEIAPMALEMWLGPPRNVLVKFNAGVDMTQAIRSVATNWQEAFPDGDFPLEYKMLTEQISGLYSQEQDFATLLRVFTGLAIFVAILGMYGFSAVSAHLKIKQICIRRVLGAELNQVAKVVSKDFLLLSFLASLLAVPVVYWLMDQWLNRFAYRAPVGPEYFVIAIVLVTVITALTLAIQVRKVMQVRPARLLRNE